VPVEDFLHGQGDDDFVTALRKGFDLLPRADFQGDAGDFLACPAATSKLAVFRSIKAGKRLKAPIDMII